MTTRRYLHAATFISGAGSAFAGYLSYTRATSGVCAFDEACPLFLGHPACYTGFALFVTAFVVCVVALASKTEGRWPIVANAVLALAGTLFSGWLTHDELIARSGYRFGLPTCAYGMLFFAALLVWSISSYRRGRPWHRAAHVRASPA